MADDDLPEPAGAPHPILAYVAQLEVRLRQAEAERDALIARWPSPLSTYKPDVLLPIISAILWAIVTLVTWHALGRAFLTALCAVNLILQLAIVARAITWQRVWLIERRVSRAVKQ